MPAYVRHLQKSFKLTMIDGLPEGTVHRIGANHVLRCCPLCGCTHQIIEMDENLPYTPMCQNFPYLYQAQQNAWRKLYPDVSAFKTLRLTVRNGK